MGRDVGRDEGSEQAEWRDLVARLEMQASVDPSQAPWPDRENLRGKTPPDTVSSAGGSGQSGATNDGDERPADRGSDDRSRVIRPAGFTRPDGPAEPAAKADDKASQAAGTDDSTLAGPRDYELDKPSDDDLAEDWDDRYIPPPLPPQPGLDPIAKGAWLALFGGPGYLLIATLIGWQISGWAALAAVAAFVAGFVVLVFRLGDGPSKRDGPDQGAVV